MFLIGVYDELYSVTAPLPARLPLDTARNDPLAAEAGLQALLRRYTWEPLGDREPEPGDALVVRPKTAAAGTLLHGMIVGVGKPVPLWHAGASGVGITALVGRVVERGYRMLDKERWAQTSFES